MLETTWAAPAAPRIWRAVHTSQRDDEPLTGIQTYSDAELARIAEEGFTGIWLFCCLYDLMQTSAFPQLNRPDAAARVAALRQLIARAARHGLGVWLYFNEPAGVPAEDPFWQSHAELQGVKHWHLHALCTSTPAVMAFFREAVASLSRALDELAGVILITACENLTHCWSKRPTLGGGPPTECPRCRVREPAALVLELLQVWAEISAARPTPFRILAWNWEWAYWYEDPQAAITTQLPAGVELLLDMEIGGCRAWRDRTLRVGEYSLAYAGPSERLTTTCAAVAAGTPVHAKLQLNNTHELASVPNIPVLRTLHSKFAAMTRLQLAGYMGCWTIGSEFTLNTHAARLLLAQPKVYVDYDAFAKALAWDYFRVSDWSGLAAVWDAFSAAFSLYPCSVQFCYFGPHNDAPARVLSLHFAGLPGCSSYQPGPLGDDLSRCFVAGRHDHDPLSLDEYVEAFCEMADRWQAAIPAYRELLALEVADPTINTRRTNEATVAQMIGHQLRSIANVLRFHRRRCTILAASELSPPCDLPADEALLEIMRDELLNAEKVLPLVEADSRLGWHQELQDWKYNARTVREKIKIMNDEMKSVLSAWPEPLAGLP